MVTMYITSLKLVRGNSVRTKQHRKIDTFLIDHQLDFKEKSGHDHPFGSSSLKQI